jgi:hypothetical protein
MPSMRPLLVFSLLVAALSLGSGAARADDTPTFADRPDDEIEERRSTVGLMTNPLAAAAGVFGLEADIVLQSKLALAVEGNVYRLGDAPGAAVIVGLLVYPFSRALRGFYVEPRLAYARAMREPLSQTDWTTDVMGLGGAAGYQWTWDYGLSLRIGIGAQAALGGSLSGVPGQFFGLGGQGLIADTSLGWTW